MWPSFMNDFMQSRRHWWLYLMKLFLFAYPFINNFLTLYKSNSPLSFLQILYCCFDFKSLFIWTQMRKKKKFPPSVIVTTQREILICIPIVTQPSHTDLNIKRHNRIVAAKWKIKCVLIVFGVWDDAKQKRVRSAL